MDDKMEIAPHNNFTTRDVTNMLHRENYKQNRYTKSQYGTLKKT